VGVGPQLALRLDRVREIGPLALWVASQPGRLSSGLTTHHEKRVLTPMGAETTPVSTTSCEGACLETDQYEAILSAFCGRGHCQSDMYGGLPSELAQALLLVRWAPPPQIYHELHQRLAQRANLLELRTQVSNQLHALSVSLL
jgi:hypothetical protein